MKCPWGRGKPQWGVEGAPPDHKDYIGWYAAEHYRGNKHMMELTGLSKKTICKFTKHYKDNTPQTSGMGRQFDVRDSPAKRVVEEVRAGVDDDSQIVL